MRLREQLIRDEGKKPFAYQDSLGYWTIGVGRLIDQRKGGRLTDDEINYLLDNDIREKTAQVLNALPFAKDLDEVRFSALVNLAFAGIGTLLQFKKMLVAMQARNWDEAAKQLLDSKYATQVGDRANRLAKQLTTGDWQ